MAQPNHKDADTNIKKPGSEVKHKPKEPQNLDEGLEETFPASDPPADTREQQPKDKKN